MPQRGSVLKIKYICFFPPACSATTSSFGGIGRRDVCLLLNITELDSTLLLVLKVPQKCLSLY